MQGFRILLIEDNPDDVELAKLAFEEAAPEVHVHVARDGVEALESLDAYHTSLLPHLVLLDLKLPRKDGIEVLRAIRACDRTRFVPVVILTSSDDEREMRTCYGLGANAYLRKPVEFSRFVSAIETVTDFWLRLNNVPGLLPSVRER